MLYSTLSIDAMGENLRLMAEKSPQSSQKSMEIALDRVPEAIQADIAEVLDLAKLCYKQHLVMAWLFGSYARGEAINDRRVDAQSQVILEYQSDVDVLVVVRGKTMDSQSHRWSRLQQKVEASSAITHRIHLLSETLTCLNLAINNWLWCSSLTMRCSSPE